MFEEEAEEYIENPKSAWKQGMTCVGSVRQAFKDGAEFGYNKANEWHYVKDGDLPKGEGTYFAVWQNDNGYKEIFIMKYEDDEEEFHWLDGDYEVQDEYIIAWKEIVLPKEIKENEKKKND